MPFYEVIVGNIGKVHEGRNKWEAQKVFNEYRRQSLAMYGRAAGEEVSLWEDNEPIKILEERFIKIGRV
jgi:hypothetical protein